MPYAGFFSEYAPRDKYIAQNNQKNSISKIKSYFKNKNNAPSIIDHEIKDTVNFNSDKVNFSKLNNSKPLYDMNSKYINRYLNISKKSTENKKNINKILRNYFENSKFKTNIKLFLMPTNDNFKLKKESFLINFNRKIPYLKSYNSKKLIDIFYSKKKDKKFRYLLIKVRVDSLLNTVENKFPWEDLLIGFQCRILREPNIYNNDFWYHFTNNYIGGENFRYQSPCNQCEIVLQQIF